MSSVNRRGGGGPLFIKPTSALKLLHHRGRTYIESDRMMSYVPMESADQTARAGGRVSTTMVVMYGRVV